MKKSRLNIPIYLNEKIVFDMMAIIEDGFSQFVTVQSSKEDSTENKDELKAGVGINKLAFLNVNLKAGLSSLEGQQNKTHETMQKTHTPTSIFQKFYDYLYDNELVTNIEHVKNFNVGDFVEVEGMFRKNPIISVIESIKQLANLQIMMKSSEKGKNKKKDDAQLLSQFNALLNGLKNDGRIDLICNVKGSNDIKHVVIPVDINNFISKDTNEVIEGEYKVLGKIIRYVDENNSINLLRNTSFSKLNNRFLDMIFKSFNSVEMADAGFESEEIITDINGPSIMIIPIAIFI